MRVLLLLTVAAASARFAVADSRTLAENALRGMRDVHPRLVVDVGGFERMRARLAGGESPLFAKGVERLVRDAEVYLDEQPVTRRFEDEMRMLTTARTAFARVTTLALAYRLTDREEFLVRAARELDAVAGFTDWNVDRHALDAAELCAAAALGLDWLHDRLEPDLRENVRDAIRAFAVVPAARHLVKKDIWWAREPRSNWNQVLHGGFVSGALLLADSNFGEAADLVASAIDYLSQGMAVYEPNGAYPEGPVYWGYGTSFNVLALAALQSSLGTDFGLAELPGFRESADYPDQMTGPSGLYFNYSDCAAERSLTMPAFWFARRFNRPGLMGGFNRCRYLEYAERRAVSGDRDSACREFALLLATMPEESASAEPLRMPYVYDSKSENRVIVQRSSQDPFAGTFVGLKGGSPSSPHGHMDGGSFVLDAGGVRWVDDLGVEKYGPLEAADIDLWNRLQDSTRWNVYRIGLSGHNTLMLDGRNQRVAGVVRAKVVREGPASRVELDLSELYTNATKVVRVGEMLGEGGGYRLADRVEGLPAGAKVRWTVHTRAGVVRDGRDLLLSQPGVPVRLRLSSAGVGAEWTFAEAPHPNPWDTPNTGVTRICLERMMPTDGALDFDVTFSPERALSAADLPLVPMPKKVELTGGERACTAEEVDAAVASYEKDPSIPSEGYRLTVDARGIRIAAASAAGAFYAGCTLRQLIGEDGRVPAVRIEDAPTFSWRGVHLDVVRHFFDKDAVIRQLETMAKFKLNVLHWHLTDDQGWRFPVDGYPALTSIVRRVQNRLNFCDLQKEGTYGPFAYTKDEMREVVRRARELHIRIMPEVEIPGHSEGILRVCPEFRCSAKDLKVVDSACVGKDSVIRFYERAIDTLCEIFPDPVIHIGGDECDRSDWARCPDCQARMRREGIGTVAGLQAWVTAHFERYLASKGRRLMGWDEIAEGGLPPGTMVMSWRGTETGVLAAKKGQDVVMTPNEYCYFDYAQCLYGDPMKYPFNAAVLVPTAKVYSFDPWKGIPQEYRRHTLGAQCNNWSEMSRTEKELEWKIWPRAAALAEVLWTYPERRDFPAFARRLEPCRRALVRSGVNAAPVPLRPHCGPKGMLTRRQDADGETFGYACDGKTSTLVLKGGILILTECGRPPRRFPGDNFEAVEVINLGDGTYFATARRRGVEHVVNVLFDGGRILAKDRRDHKAEPVSVGTTQEERALRAALPGIFAKAASHYRTLEASATKLMIDEKGGRRIPHGFLRDRREIDMRSIFWWTAGHFPGSLWYLHEATGDDAFRSRATAWTEHLAPASTMSYNHDIGFIMYCSFGNARRVLKTDRYDGLLREAAGTLMKRFNPRLGLIRSWGEVDDRKDFLVIPDNMMNLELLEWASRKGDFGPGRAACSHATVSMKHHFRPDGGTYHVLNYSQEDGRVQEIRRGQGASCETAWSRGQSWAIYGYTMMYRETGDERYLSFAQKLADFAMNHPNMPADGVPYWDYGAPGEERDSSAASIMASGLLELQRYVSAEKGGDYRAFAARQLLSLSSPAYFSEGGEIGHWLLKHGVGYKPVKSEIDTPLDYGDYYYLEALLRFKRLK